MVLKIFFTRDEIEEFFRANNITVVSHTRGYWTKEYHNRCEWIDGEVPGIEVGGKIVDAEKVFEKLMEYQLKKTIAPVNNETQNIINLIAKKL